MTVAGQPESPAPSVEELAVRCPTTLSPRAMPAAARGALATWDLSRSVHPVVLVVTELVTNAVR